MNKNAIRIIRNIYWQAIRDSDLILSKNEYESDSYLQNLKINNNIGEVLELFTPKFKNSKTLRKKLFKELPEKYKNDFNVLYLFLKEFPELYQELNKKTINLIESEFKNLEKNFNKFDKYLKDKNINEIDTVMLILSISNNLRENGIIKIKINSFYSSTELHNKKKIFELTKENINRTIDLINNNQRIYYLKPSFNDEKFYDYTKEYQVEEENAYIHDYITAIGNVLFSFNNLLIQLVYKYCKEKNVNYLINQSNEYIEKMNNLTKKYENLFNIPNNFINMSETESKNFFGNFLELKNDYVLKNKRLNEINKNGLKNYIKSNNNFFLTKKDFHIRLDTDNDWFKNLKKYIIKQEENEYIYYQNKINNMNDKDFDKLIKKIKKNYNIYFLDKNFYKQDDSKKEMFLNKIIKEYSNNNISDFNKYADKLTNNKNNDFFSEKSWFKYKYELKNKDFSKIKNLYLILLEKYKKNMNYGIKCFINLLNVELENFKKEYKEINKNYNNNKSAHPKTYTIDDLFNKNINNNDITQLVNFFVKQNLVPQKYTRIFQLYEIIFRHQYAHGFNDFFKSLLIKQSNILISNNKLFSAIDKEIIPDFNYSYHENNQYVEVKNLCSQDELRIYLSKFSILNQDEVSNFINNNLYDEFFSKENIDELIFSFKKSSCLMELKNLSEYNSNNKLKIDIEKIELLYKNLEDYLIKNKLKIEDYLIVDSEEKFSLNILIKEIKDFIGCLEHKWLKI